MGIPKNLKCEFGLPRRFPYSKSTGNTFARARLGKVFALRAHSPPKSCMHQCPLARARNAPRAKVQPRERGAAPLLNALQVGARSVSNMDLAIPWEYFRSSQR